MCSNTGMDQDSALSPILTTMLRDTVSPPPTSDDQTDRTFDFVVKSRKGWKSSKNGETVWPPELEAALIEGLKKYVPRNIREARSLGRLPLRNRFISDHIYQKTGKRRTPKQVGSRIQQMRDSWAGRQLMNLLRPYTPQRGHASSSDSEISCNDSIPPRYQDGPCSDSRSSEPSASDGNLGVAFTNVVYIDLIHPLVPQTGAAMAETLTSLSANQINKSQSFPHPRHIRSIDPTVTFVSQSTVSGHAVCRVHMHDIVVYSERVSLEHAGRLSSDSGEDADGNSAHLYRSALAPGYWERICNSVDPTQFTIEQEVRLDSSTTSERPLFSSLYTFRFTQSPQSSPSGDLQTDLKHLSIHDEFGGSATRNSRSCESWDVSLAELDQEITLDDDTLFEEYFLSLMQSPLHEVDLLESQSDTLFSPSPPSSRPHSTALTSTSEMSDSCSLLSSPDLSPPVTTPPILFGFPVVGYDALTQEVTKIDLNPFHFSEGLELKDTVW